MSWHRLAIGFFEERDQLNAVRAELLDLGFRPADLCVAGPASLVGRPPLGANEACAPWSDLDMRSDGIGSRGGVDTSHVVLCGSARIIEMLTKTATPGPMDAMGRHSQPGELRERLGNRVSRGALVLLIDCQTSERQDQSCRCLLRHSSQAVQTLEFQAAAE